MNWVLLFLNQPCLPLGGCLPFLAACGGAGCCSQPGKASPQQALSHASALGGMPCCTPCPGFAASGTLGMPTFHSPGLQQPTAPASTSFTPSDLSPLPSSCHPWAAMGLWAALPAVPWGLGTVREAETPPQVARGREEEWEGGRETGQPTAQLGCAGSPPRPHHPIYYPSAIHRARQMPPNKYPQTIGWEGPVRLLMNKHEGLWTQLPLFAKWDRLCSRRLKFSRGRAVFQCPPNRRGASFIS